MYTKIGINVEHLDDFNDSNIESILCKIGKGDHIMQFGLYYRPPKNSKENDKAILDQITNFCKTKSVVVGDFNYPGLNWHTMQADNQSTDFRDMCLDSFLHQHVFEPTRNENILDIILSTERDIIQSIEVVEPLGNSDHNSVNFDLVSDSFTGSVSYFYNYKKAKFEEMKESLREVNWSEAFENLDTEKSWNIFKNKVNLVTEKFVPCKQSKVERNPKWLNSNVRNKIKKKKQAWKKYKASNTNENFAQYKKFEKEAKAAIKTSKKDYEKISQ